MFKTLLTILALLSTNVQSTEIPDPPPYSDMSNQDLTELECAAVNLYHESRGESVDGNLMVMAVVLERKRARGWRDTVCGVVFQKYQFEWTSDGKSDKIEDLVAWRYVYVVAKEAMDNVKLTLKFGKGTDHYHAKTMKKYPKWSKHKDMIKIKTVDNHIFYRWEG